MAHQAAPYPSLPTAPYCAPRQAYLPTSYLHIYISVPRHIKSMVYSWSEWTGPRYRCPTCWAQWELYRVAGDQQEQMRYFGAQVVKGVALHEPQAASFPHEASSWSCTKCQVTWALQ